METNMEKTYGRYVVTAQKNHGCSYEGGKKEYRFCRDSTELIDVLSEEMAFRGGDNYSLYMVCSEQEAADLDLEWAGETMYMINSHAGSEIKLAKDFDNDEMKLADYLTGDCGDWNLRFDDEDELDQDERINILKTEYRFDAAIEEAWSNLW